MVTLDRCANDRAVAAFMNEHGFAVDVHHRAITWFEQGFFQGFLHGEHTGGLALPAAVARALVFNAQRDAEKAFGCHFGGRVIYVCQVGTAC